MDDAVPPGWPEQVRPPGAPDWERTAVAWLFDLVPPDYRAHEVLRRYPVLLARFAADHVRAGLAAAREGWRTVRVELADELPADAIEAAMTAYEREDTRLAAAAHVRAGLAAAREGWRTVRVELADQLPADAIEAAMTAYEREGTRLAAAARGVEVVAGALRGERWVPRL